MKKKRKERLGRKKKHEKKVLLRKAGGKETARKNKKRPEEKETKVLEATILSLSRNFAFARPESGEEDIFLFAEDLLGAFPGDRVQIGHIRQKEKGPTGRVEKILKEGPRKWIGVLTEQEGKLFFQADQALRYPIQVDPKWASSGKAGEKVQAQLRFSRSGELLAQVLTVYGEGQVARVCADAILDQQQIPLEFAPEVLAAAEKAAAEPITEEVLKGRLDFRDHAVCTIDSAEAKDLDDAISVSRTKAGYRLGVHIADVSHYVRPGTPLDQEALNRGTSVYFADRVVPMLPECISNGVCSLNAGTDKLALTALIDLDRKGEILSYTFRKSVICSKVRGVYSEVNQLFSGTASKELKKKYAPVIRSLNAARELASILQQRSRENGCVDLESTESFFVLDDKGVCVDVQPRSTGESQQMIEQLMITANRAAAMLAREKGLPFVYRVHEQPAPDRVDTLAELVSSLGLDARPLRHKGSIGPGDFSAIMKQAEHTKAKKVVGHQLLRTMAKARYDVKPLGHFGLSLADYCHFTSPIRRYPDTCVHRILSDWLLHKDAKGCQRRYESFVQEAAQTSSDREVRAMTAERTAEDCYMAEYMKAHLGEVFHGIISGVTMRGVFVELANTVEGFLPVESIPGARFSFDGWMTQKDENSGKVLTIGQEITVKAAAADVASGKIDFVYEGNWPKQG